MDEKLGINHEVQGLDPVKSEIKKAFDGILSVPNDPYYMVNHLTKYFSADTVRKALCRVGGVQEIKNMLLDPHVYAAMEKRKAGIRGAKLKLEAENQSEIDWLTNVLNLDEAFRFILENNWRKWWIGYGIDELIWGKVGSDIVLKKMRAVPFYWFSPAEDLKSVRYKEYLWAENPHNQGGDQIATYGKYLLTVKDGTFTEPHGQGLAFAIYFISKFKMMGWDFWGQWLQKYASGFIKAKVSEEQADPETMKLIKDELTKAIRGSAIVYKEGNDVEIEYPSSSGEQFKAFRDSAIDDINMAILGETLTSRVQSGSQAAATVHDSIQKEKIELDMALVEQSLNRLIEYAYVLNFRDKSKAPKIKVYFEKGLQMERAQRDALLVPLMGKKLTEEYLIRSYDFQQGDFEDSIQENSQLFENNSDKLNLSHDHTETFETQKQAKRVRERQDITDQLVELLLKKGSDHLDIEDFYAAIEASADKKSLDDNLANLLDVDTTAFEEDLTQALFFNLLEGFDD